MADLILHYIPIQLNECLFCGKHIQKAIFSRWETHTSGIVSYEKLLDIKRQRIWSNKYKPCVIEDYPGYLERLKKIFNG